VLSSQPSCTSFAATWKGYTDQESLPGAVVIRFDNSPRGSSSFISLVSPLNDRQGILQQVAIYVDAAAIMKISSAFPPDSFRALILRLLGSSLGLEASDVKDAVMSGIPSPSKLRVALAEDDIQGVCALYPAAHTEPTSDATESASDAGTSPDGPSSSQDGPFGRPADIRVGCGCQGSHGGASVALWLWGLLVLGGLWRRT